MNSQPWGSVLLCLLPPLLLPGRHHGGNSSGTLGAVCVVWQRHPMSTVEHGRLPCALEHDPGGRERRAPGRSPPWTDVLPSLGVVGPHHGSLGTSCVPGRGPVHMLCGWAIFKSGSWWVPQCGGGWKWERWAPSASAPGPAGSFYTTLAAQSDLTRTTTALLLGQSLRKGNGFRADSPGLTQETLWAPEAGLEQPSQHCGH